MEATCISECSFYPLTYGNKYEILDDDEQKIKLRGDNGQARWYPKYYFDLTGSEAPRVESVWIEYEEWGEQEDLDPEDLNSDVKVELSDGSLWVATFFSYQNIHTNVQKNKRTGECLSGKYFWASDMILVDRVTRKRVIEVTTHLLHSGELKSIFSQIEKDTE